jgi:hypothetical protein
MNVTAQIIPWTNRPFLEVAKEAHRLRQGLYLTERGQLVISPIRLPGWQPMPVVVKQAA